MGVQAIGIRCKLRKTNNLFSSTNSSDIRMQKVLTKVGFTFSGKIDGLDDVDPELLYYKRLKVKSDKLKLECFDVPYMVYPNH